MTTPAIPDRPEAVTPAWLSAALGADVLAVDELERHAGTTGRLRLRLHHAAGSTGPETVFVKLPPFDEQQRRLVAATDMGRREARFYEGPATEVPVRVPRVHHAAHGDDPTEYVMVLEDLVASGCTFTSRETPHAEDHGRGLVEDLARLHARFWDDPRFDDELAWVPAAMRGGYAAKLVDRARSQFAGELPRVFDELCRLYVDHDREIVELWDEGERTLIHGDTHAGNQFLDHGRLGLYDWAVLSRSPGIRDVAIYLGNSCPTDLRRLVQDDWIRTYHRTLVDAGVAAPPFDALWTRYRRTVLYAWVAATTTAAMGDRWQPIEVGRAGMIRATEACADLGTVEAFRDVL